MVSPVSSEGDIFLTGALNAIKTLPCVFAPWMFQYFVFDSLAVRKDSYKAEHFQREFTVGASI